MLQDSKCELRAVDRLLEVFSGSLTTPGRWLNKLKEGRAKCVDGCVLCVLSLTPTCCCDVSCRPVCFSLDDVLLEATVVLATLVQSGSGIPAAPPPTHRQHPLLGCSQAEEKSAPWQLLINGPLVSRCGNDDVADPPAVATPAASRGHQPDATMIDVVPSSQGSPAELLDELLLLQPNDRLLPPYDQRCSGASPTVTTATSCRGAETAAPPSQRPLL